MKEGENFEYNRSNSVITDHQTYVNLSYIDMFNSSYIYLSDLFLCNFM